MTHHDARALGDPNACAALLAMGDRVDALTETEWWLVELVCRQGMQTAAAAERIGVGVEQAQRMWRELGGLVIPFDGMSAVDGRGSDGAARPGSRHSRTPSR
jgi:hypothetical protein